MAKRIDIIAGGVTDELFRKGLVNDRNMLSASALVHPQNHGLVVQAQEDFLNAGATLLVTSNYSVTPGLGFTTEEIREYTRLAGRLAKEALDRSSTESAVKICGSLPPLMPSYRTDRTIERQRGLDTYLLIGEALWPFADVYLAESMSSLAEAKLAYEAVENLQKPVMISFALNSTGQLRSGESVQGSIKKLLAFCEERAQEQAASSSGSSSGGTSMLQGILFNCSQPEDIAKVLRHIYENKGLFGELKDKRIKLGGYGDRISSISTAGVLEEKLGSGAMHSVLDMEIFASFVMRWLEDGAEIVGGCCGVPPSYLERIHERLQEQQKTSP
jgi:S-methylmethionine-dependent homocysteine/selenocysteine methylase